MEEREGVKEGGSERTSNRMEGRSGLEKQGVERDARLQDSLALQMVTRVAGEERRVRDEEGRGRAAIKLQSSARGRLARISFAREAAALQLQEVSGFSPHPPHPHRSTPFHPSLQLLLVHSIYRCTRQSTNLFPSHSTSSTQIHLTFPYNCYLLLNSSPLANSPPPRLLQRCFTCPPF